MADFSLKRGTTFAKRFEIFSSETERFDLTGSTVVLYIGRHLKLTEGNGLTVDPTIGQVDLRLGPDRTAKLPAGAHKFSLFVQTEGGDAYEVVDSTITVSVTL